MKKTISKEKEVKKVNPVHAAVDEVVKLFKAHQKLATDIMIDYVSDGLMIEEIATAEEKFLEDVESIKDDEQEVDFEHVLSLLHSLESDDVDCDKLIAVINDVEPEALADHLTAQGYMFVKVPDLLKRDKLEEFINAEIYPHYSDQIENVLL